MSDYNHHCGVLEIQPGASLAEIEKAYRLLVKVWHPDRFGKDSSLRDAAAEKLRAINAAYEFLKANPQQNAGKPVENHTGECRYRGGDERLKPVGALDIRGRSAVVNVSELGISLIVASGGEIEESAHYPAATIKRIRNSECRWFAPGENKIQPRPGFDVALRNEDVHLVASDPEGILREINVRLTFTSGYYAKLFSKRCISQFQLAKWVPPKPKPKPAPVVKPEPPKSSSQSKTDSPKAAASTTYKPVQKNENTPSDNAEGLSTLALSGITLGILAAITAIVALLNDSSSTQTANIDANERIPNVSQSQPDDRQQDGPISDPENSENQEQSKLIDSVVGKTASDQLQEAIQECKAERLFSNPRLFATGEGSDRKWQKAKYSVGSENLDVRRTDSETNPFDATLIVKCSLLSTEQVETKSEANMDNQFQKYIPCVAKFHFSYNASEAVWTNTSFSVDKDMSNFTKF